MSGYYEDEPAPEPDYDAIHDDNQVIEEPEEPSCES